MLSTIILIFLTVLAGTMGCAIIWVTVSEMWHLRKHGGRTGK